MFVIFLTTDNNYRRPAMGKRVCRITFNSLILKTLNIRKRTKKLFAKNLYNKISTIHILPSIVTIIYEDHLLTFSPAKKREKDTINSTKTTLYINNISHSYTLKYMVLCIVKTVKSTF